MFIVHKKGLAKTGRSPTLLTAYGGFNVSLTPTFSRTAYLWMEHGGIYAVANLRGGAEFGEDWHRAGMLDKKQNVFDDMIAAAEHLISEKYTDKNHLAIQGGSNGGLLMGAMITQRPDLFRAVVCQVPLLDMLHYQDFQIAKLWIPEYGTSENPEQFKWLYAYSPYHHVKTGAEYPAVLFMTADTDTRVDSMHAKKMAALMQAEAKNGASHARPILLRIETQRARPQRGQASDQADRRIYGCVFVSVLAAGGETVTASSVVSPLFAQNAKGCGTPRVGGAKRKRGVWTTGRAPPPRKSNKGLDRSTHPGSALTRRTESSEGHPIGHIDRRSILTAAAVSERTDRPKGARAPRVRL